MILKYQIVGIVALLFAYEFCLMKNILVLILIVTNAVYGQKQKKTDTLKTRSMNEVILTNRESMGPYRMQHVDDMRLMSGKKNEVVKLSTLNADLSMNNYRQILGKVPGLSIWENDGSGIQTAVSTRGLSPNRSWEFNTRMNGCDISSDAFGYPEAYFTPPTEALEKIEIIRGAASLQYGTQFGGVMNYVTKKNISNRPFSFETQQTTGSYGLYNAYNAIGGKKNKFSYYAYLHHRSADGWRENSYYKTNTGHVSLQYEFSAKWKASLEYTRMHYLSQQPGGLTDSMFANNAQQSVRERNWFSTPWNTSAMHIYYDVNKDSKFKLSLFNTYAQRNSIGFMSDITVPDTFHYALGSYANRQIDRDWYNNLGAELRFLHEYDLFGMNQVLSVGIRAYQGQTLRKKKGIGSGLSDFDLTLVSPYTSQNGTFDYKNDLTMSTRNAALFVEHQFQLNSHFFITPGVRLEYIESGVKGTIDKPIIGEQLLLAEQERVLLLSGLGVEYTTSKTTNVYANFSQSYRPVTYSELIPASTTDSIDQGLQDASGFNIDFGIRGEIADFLSFDLGGFYLLYGNRVGTIVVDGRNLRTNVGTSVSKGIESYIELNLLKCLNLDRMYGNLHVFSSLAFIDARYTKWNDPAVMMDSNRDIRGNRVENAPRLVHRYGISYKYKRLSASFQVNETGDVYTDAMNTIEPNGKGTIGKLDGYRVMDLSCTYLINGKYNVKAGINNLANVRYATRRSGGYPGPGILPGNGRTLYVSIGAKF